MNHDHHLVRHIKEAGRRILSDTREGRAAFDNDRRIQDAILRNIGVIGEVASNLSEDFRQAHPAIPWKQIRGMRNELIHRYFRIDFEIVWTATQVHIPALLAYLDLMNAETSPAPQNTTQDHPDHPDQKST